jgi:hypothetical protein
MMLGHKVLYFAYPYGNIGSNQRTIEEAGYKYAFTLIDRNKGRFNPYLIPRSCINDGMMLGNNKKMNKALFEVELSGLGDRIFFRWIKNIIKKQ